MEKISIQLEELKMSVCVYIDGRPAECREDYREVIGGLGPIPDESQGRFELWTNQPCGRATSQSVWLNPPGSARVKWLADGGAALQSTRVHHGMEDHLLKGNFSIKVRSAVPTPIMASVLAAFLAHDFPLVDAVMLARAYRGAGWPTSLTDYPLPLGEPSSRLPFAEFPRFVGLYAVVPTSDWVHRLSRLSVPVVQLRYKDEAATRHATEVQRAVHAVSGTDTLLFINDHWRLAVECHAYGVHLGQEDVAKADLGAIRHAGLRLGISTHCIYEMLCAHACKPSYLALGAIYPTVTKPMRTTPQGLRRLEHYVRLMSPHYPLVAIGGIDLSRIEAVWSAGVDCAAVLRAIVDADDPRRATLDLLATTPRLGCGSDAA
jgi:thiamine-phosphate pyrophosphorylase